MDVDPNALRMVINIFLGIGIILGTIIGIGLVLWFRVIKKAMANKEAFIASLSDRDYRKYKEMNKDVWKD